MSAVSALAVVDGVVVAVSEMSVTMGVAVVRFEIHVKTPNPN